MGKDAPSPPNPIQTAMAQTGTNVATAVANANLANINQNTPYGSLNYGITDNYSWTDPSTGQAYTIPKFTATQTLTPTGQATVGQNQAAQYNLASLGNTQSARIGGLLSAPFNLNNAPTAGTNAGILGVGAPKNTYDPGWGITRSYGPSDNYSADRQRVEDALMARMNPQLQIQQQQVQQQLADQGIRYGSQAYSDAMMNYSRQANDARYSAIQQAGQEQQRMSDMAAQQAAFQNQAQQQGYQQNAAQASFYNAGLAQQLQQQQAGFNAANAARNQYTQEQFALRNQPLNEITALLSGSQVQNPSFVNNANTQIPTTDVAGLVNQNFQQQMGIYQQQSANSNALLGGILGLGAGALKGGMLSDVREKEDITPIGSVLTAKVDDERPMGSTFGARAMLPIYGYAYKDDPAKTRHIGPMAQDVEKTDKAAVTEHDGRKYIDPVRVMGNILRAG